MPAMERCKLYREVPTRLSRRAKEPTSASTGARRLQSSGLRLEERPSVFCISHKLLESLSEDPVTTTTCFGALRCRSQLLSLLQGPAHAVSCCRRGVLQAKFVTLDR